MTRFGFLILIIISLLAGSCSGRKQKLDKKNLIPEKDLVSLLTDIHIADGLLAIPRIISGSSSFDSISTYYQVIEKHGYTKEMMDKTMNYYFSNDPKKLNKIYDQVLGKLSEMESRIVKESTVEFARISNLWKGKNFYSIPSLTGNESTLFDLPLNTRGLYVLSFTATLYPDDQSINPRAIMYSCSPDSLDTGKRHYVKSINYIKDGRPHTYILALPDKGIQVLHLRGWLYDSDSRPYDFEKHFVIENISLSLKSLVEA
jgi:Domain of unknown function (DUF4296)